jgi:hypothetical protein
VAIRAEGSGGLEHFGWFSFTASGHDFIVLLFRIVLHKGRPSFDTA